MQPTGLGTVSGTTWPDSQPIKTAKAAYRERIEGHFTTRDLPRVWKGIQHITNCRSSKDPPAGNYASLAEELNLFFAWFEKGSDYADSHSPRLVTAHPADTRG